MATLNNSFEALLDELERQTGKLPDDWHLHGLTRHVEVIRHLRDLLRSGQLPTLHDCRLLFRIVERLAVKCVLGSGKSIDAIQLRCFDDASQILLSFLRCHNLEQGNQLEQWCRKTSLVYMASMVSGAHHEKYPGLKDLLNFIFVAFPTESIRETPPEAAFQKVILCLYGLGEIAGRRLAEKATELMYACSCVSRAATEFFREAFSKPRFRELEELIDSGAAPSMELAKDVRVAYKVFALRGGWSSVGFDASEFFFTSLVGAVELSLARPEALEALSTTLHAVVIDLGARFSRTTILVGSAASRAVATITKAMVILASAGYSSSIEFPLGLCGMVLDAQCYHHEAVASGFSASLQQAELPRALAHVTALLPGLVGDRVVDTSSGSVWSTPVVAFLEAASTLLEELPNQQSTLEEYRAAGGVQAVVEAGLRCSTGSNSAYNDAVVRESLRALERLLGYCPLTPKAHIDLTKEMVVAGLLHLMPLMNGPPHECHRFVSSSTPKLYAALTTMKSEIVSPDDPKMTVLRKAAMEANWKRRRQLCLDRTLWRRAAAAGPDKVEEAEGAAADTGGPEPVKAGAGE
jgi:hypothetical protein